MKKVSGVLVVVLVALGVSSCATTPKLVLLKEQYVEAEAQKAQQEAEAQKAQAEAQAAQAALKVKSEELGREYRAEASRKEAYAQEVMRQAEADRLEAEKLLAASIAPEKAPVPVAPAPIAPEKAPAPASEPEPAPIAPKKAPEPAPVAPAPKLDFSGPPLVEVEVEFCANGGVFFAGGAVAGGGLTVTRNGSGAGSELVFKNGERIIYSVPCDPGHRFSFYSKGARKEALKLK